MAQPSSGSENKLDDSRLKLQREHGGVYPFPGFIVNNTNNVEEHTPITKIPCGSALSSANSAKSTADSSSTATTKTPPVEPSVSPEIQSSFYRSVHVSGAAPSACYGAGHVLSGVTDKRKCKARGILSVGPKNSLDIPEDDILCDSNGKTGQDVFTKSRPSIIPFPVEASISWHLSPSYVNDDDDEESSVVGEGDSPNRLHQSCQIAESSPSSPCGSLCGMFRTPEVQGLLESSSDRGTQKLSSTSGDTPHDTPVISLEERLLSFDFNRECSPFSVDSLSSGNIMQTPNSDSSLEKDASFSWLKEGVQPKHQFESELDHVTNVLQHESLSPNGNSSPWDPPRLSFELSDISSPSGLTNPNHFRESSDIQASWISNSTSENVSESQIRVSWRDGLISGSFEKDDLDCCRLSSDEEKDADGLLESPIFLEPKITSVPIQTNPCEESICTDDGGPITSRDSDWTLDYKNRSFEI